MACNLTKDQDLVILNEVSQAFINEVLSNKDTGDKKGIDALIKTVYNSTKKGYSEDISLQFAQAIPEQLYHIITKDTENNYLSKLVALNPPIDLTYIAQLNNLFENLDNVKNFVSQTKKLTKQELLELISKRTKSSQNIIQNNIPLDLISSVMTNNKARPAYANVTTGQMAHAENPDTISEKLKDVKDAQKIMFYNVIKTLIWYSRNNPNQEPGIDLPNGKQATIKLLAKSIQNVDQNLLTNDDKAMLKSNPDFNIITTMLADQDGNVLQFDEDGNIVEEGGRAVYQYIRPVIKRDGKLFLGNRAGKLYTLVAAEDLAKQELRNMLDAGQILTSAEKKRVRGEIKAKQLETLNAIYRLTQTLKSTETKKEDGFFTERFLGKYNKAFATLGGISNQNIQSVVKNIDSGKTKIKLGVVSEEEIAASGFFAKILNKGLTGYILHADEKIIGAVFVRKDGYISTSEIHPDLRQKGLGSKLYNQVNQIRLKSNLEVLKSIDRTSQSVIALWKSLVKKGLAIDSGSKPGASYSDRGVFEMLPNLLLQSKIDKDGVLLQITGGSYGITQTKLTPLSQTEFADSLNMIYIIDSGPLSGHSHFPVTRNRAGIVVDERVYLQRLDMPKSVADNLAKILTTKAKLNNEELSANERLAYYNTFLSNQTFKNGIQVKVEEVEGLNQLVVKLATEKKDKRTYTSVNLEDPKAEALISKHLQSFVKGTYPANMSFQKEFAEAGILNKDATYLDYEFGQDVKGNTVVKAITKNYFDFITQKAQVDYAVEKDNYFAGVNAYLEFVVPEEMQSPSDEVLELGHIGPVEEIDSNIDSDKVKKEALKRNFITTNLHRKGMLTNNVNKADVTFGIAVDFKTIDLEHIKTKVGENWQAVSLGNAKGNKGVTAEYTQRIIDDLNSYGKDITINMVGNHMGDLAKKGWSQKKIDEVVLNLFNKIKSKVSIGNIIVEGDSGIGHAVAKAAIQLKIPIQVVAHKNPTIKVYNKWSKSGFTTKKLGKFEYISRLFGKPWTNAFFKRKAKPKAKVEVKPIVTDTDSQPVEKTKNAPIVKKRISLDDILGDSEDIGLIERSKKRQTYLDKIFTSKSAEKKARTWYKTTPLTKLVDFERMTGIVNSDAYGHFYNTAWALKNDEAQGLGLVQRGKKGKAQIYDDAMDIDMYHEAWHVFSHLVLTPEQRATLYNEVRGIKKYKEIADEEIEEVLAEDYRSYGRSQSTKLGRVVSKIFELIRNFLTGMFTHYTVLAETSATGHIPMAEDIFVDFRKVRDLPMVKEMFENLYTGNFTMPVLNSIDTFQPLKLERSKLIKPLKRKSKQFVEFTIDDSARAVDIIDTMMGETFQNYNKLSSTSSTALKILGNEQQKILLYDNIKRKLLKNKSDLEQDLLDIEEVNKDSENPDLLREVRLAERIELLDKMVDNYGDVSLAIDRKLKNGVVAFHMEKSRFTILREQYLEDIDDATSPALFTTKEGNSISAKQLTSEETMLFLTGIFKQERDDEGNIVRQIDEYGLPVLENSDIIWNKLARVLQGSFDVLDIYNKLVKEQENYPEFVEILAMLPSPAQEKYKNGVEFDTETNFWQDFKKPQIPYIQNTVSKTVIEKRRREGDKIIPEKSKYESRVSRANFNLYAVLSDWKTNFATASTSVNPYVKKDKPGLTNMLDIEKVVADFSNNGQLIPNKAIFFLKSIGVEMDMSSYEIFKMATDKEKLFSASFGVDFIFNVIRTVDKARRSNDIELQAAAVKFSKNPLYYLQKGLPKAIREMAGKDLNVKTRLSTLATIQNRFSDGFSNYSVLSPEKNKVWEHFVDNTITRIVTSLNYAKTWQQLTNEGSDKDALEEADPNGMFQHMRWLSTEINSQSKYSVLLNAMYDLKEGSPTWGQKKPGFNIEIKNIGGTQLNEVDSSNFTGITTANADVTTKFLQEFHTLLESGVQEFMRHASKSTSLSLTFNNLQIDGYGKNKNQSLYIDIQDFNPKNLSGVSTPGQNKGFNIVLGYLSGEAKRIAVYRKNNLDLPGYNKPAVRKGTGEKVTAAEAFTIFDDVLSEDTQKMLYDFLDEHQDDIADGIFTLKEYINEDQDFRTSVKEDVLEYFTKQSQANLNVLDENRYVDSVLMNEIKDASLSRGQQDKVLVDAYTWNSWIHNFETLILAYGDPVQYNHAKEEFHKRNAGLASGGRSLRADFRARVFINSDNFRRVYAEKQGYQVRDYDGTMHMAVMKEYKIKKSPQYDHYYKRHVAEYTRRFMKSGLGKKEATKKAKDFAIKVLKPYTNMELADGQGYITFESYRMFKRLEGEWFPPMEKLYNKIANGKIVSLDEIDQFFPPIKYQYFGNIKSKVLPVTSFHKFSLAPLIPGVIDESDLADLHDKMMREQLDYVTFESGSKISQIAEADNIVKEDGSIDNSVEFTKNIIFAEFLKNQTAVPIKYKNVSIFSTQLRKLILEGLYENGVINTLDEAEIKDELVKKYIDSVSNHTKLVTAKLLNEIGFIEQEDGTVIANSEESITKLAQLIRDNLTKEDILGDNLIDIIDVTDSGELLFDLSFHPEANKIEKVLLSVINKTIIKQKVKGEALVQKSSAMYDGIFGNKFKKATASDIKKYVGSNFLPTYFEKDDGTTSAMKVMIALQGDYENLLNLEYKGEIIGVATEDGTIDMEQSLKRLNEAIKDDEWLDAEKGLNRKAIAMVGVRIPVQGLNSIENMEIYHFLPPQAGNIIIPPAEIVAKSGADFDIDKLSIFMKHLDYEGNVIEKAIEDTSKFLEIIKKSNDQELNKDLFASQIAGSENQLIDIMAQILALPENFISLTTPNSTILLQEIAEDLSKYVMEYNPKQNFMTQDTGSLSPTRILEARYNLYKHESNVVGKQTLGLGAIENTFNVVFNYLGAKMLKEYEAGENKGDDTRKINLFLRHNKLDDRISLSGLYDVDGINKISDIISQMINGWVDVEKNAWVFFIQGNYEVAPILLSLVKSGVPVKEAIYFVSQPLVREYVKEQRILKSTYAEPLKRQAFGGVKASARRSILSKFFTEKFGTDKERYETGQSSAEKLLEGRKEKAFTETEMYDLIKNSAVDQDESYNDLSRSMFLHYLQIEDQTEGIKQLKLAANPDTTTMIDVTAALMSQQTLDNLNLEPTLDKKLKQDLIENSIISSFFNNKLIEDLGKELFAFRYDSSFDYILDVVQDKAYKGMFIENFGMDYKTLVPQTFRNDFLSFLYQNASRKYYLGNTYMSKTLDRTVPVKEVKSLRAGVAVKDGVIYIDEKQVRADFANKIWTDASRSKTSYAKQGLHPLKLAHFTGNSSSNYQEYLRFVIERELIRSEVSKVDFQKSQMFTDMFENQKDSSPFGEEKLKSMLYEQYIALKALTNTANTYTMFSDPENAYAVRFKNMVEKYNLKDKFNVLKRLEIDVNADRTMFNIYLNDKDLNNFRSNLYSKNLTDLADRTVQKVDDLETNMYISDFFANITTYAVFQAGITKSKYNFLSITDFENFINTMKPLVTNYLNATAVEKQIVLTKFLESFIIQNLKTNVNRFRFKDYLNETSFTKLGIEGESDVVSEPFKQIAYKVSPTNAPGVNTYNNVSDTPKTISNIVEANKNVVFIHPISYLQLASDQKLTGMARMKDYAKGNSLPLITGIQDINDDFSDISSEDYEKIKDFIIDQWSDTVKQAENLINDGKQIALPYEGIGNITTMPQDLFISLSKILLSQLSYVNPGSENVGDIFTELDQEINDAEILEKYRENPLKC